MAPRVLGFLTAAALVTGVSVAAAPQSSADRRDSVLIGFDKPEYELVLRRAIDGAVRRLENARCTAVFADFEDASGGPLPAGRAPFSDAPIGFLRSVRFFDASFAPQCRDGSSLAFTTPGAGAIFICARAFEARALENPKLAQIIIIHELLHTLGLGENPPTSQAITRQVMARCGR